MNENNSSQIIENIKWILFNDRSSDLSQKFHGWLGDGKSFIVTSEDGSLYRISASKIR